MPDWPLLLSGEGLSSDRTFFILPFFNLSIFPFSGSWLGWGWRDELARDNRIDNFFVFLDLVDLQSMNSICYGNFPDISLRYAVTRICWIWNHRIGWKSGMSIPSHPTLHEKKTGICFCVSFSIGTFHIFLSNIYFCRLLV